MQAQTSKKALYFLQFGNYELIQYGRLALQCLQQASAFESAGIPAILRDGLEHDLGTATAASAPNSASSSSTSPLLAAIIGGRGQQQALGSAGTDNVQLILEERQLQWTCHHSGA